MADSSIEAPGLGERLAPLRGRWEALSANQRVGSILALAVLVGVGATLWGTRGEEEMTVLFSNLSRDDSARVAQRLSEMGIRHRSEEEGTVILIPESVVHETRMSLAASGLPGSSGVGFEVFDEQRFGESEFSERVKYHRALEGELARTISHLAGVERARVHLVMPNRSLFTSDETPASASVVLHLRTGWQIRDDQAGGIVHLIASSVRGLDPGSVTLVDGDGRSIAGATESESEGAAGALDLRRQLERSKEEAVQALLDETLGAGRAVVRVAAEMSFTREERTEERYLPEESAARSFQIQEERDANATPTAAGVPGAASNLPGGAAPQTGTEGLGLARRSETRNFEISKTIRHAIEPVGRLTRMNVALVLDGTWTGEGEDRSFSPLPQEELDRIEAIVASAAGIDTNRGDQITVACVPFATSANLRAFDPAEGDVLAPYYRYTSLAQIVGSVLAALLLLLLLRRGLRRLSLRAAAARAGADGAALPTPVTVRELEDRIGGQADRNRAIVEATRSGAPEEIQILAAELAAEDPTRAARVVQGWLTEGHQADAQEGAEVPQ